MAWRNWHRHTYRCRPLPRPRCSQSSSPERGHKSLCQIKFLSQFGTRTSEEITTQLLSGRQIEQNDNILLSSLLVLRGRGLGSQRGVSRTGALSNHQDLQHLPTRESGASETARHALWCFCEGAVLERLRRITWFAHKDKNETTDACESLGQKIED
jgi:hypothetical protein